jgi:hypothetical protein
MHGERAEDWRNGHASRWLGTRGGHYTRAQTAEGALLVASVAVLVVAAVLALAVWVGPLATSGIGTEEGVPKAGAGSALIHDDAGNVKPR